MQELFSKFYRFFFRKLTEFQPNFFSNIKKLTNLFLKFFFFEKFFLQKFFSNFFFFENFFLRTLFSTNFFLVNIFMIEFFLAKIFLFTKIFLWRLFSQYFREFFFLFDVCEIMYFAKFFIRNFTYCEFFVLQFWCREKKL